MSSELVRCFNALGKHSNLGEHLFQIVVLDTINDQLEICAPSRLQKLYQKFVVFSQIYRELYNHGIVM